MDADLRGKRVAILVDDGFEQSELTSPREALMGAGAQVDVVSPKKDTVRSKRGTEWVEDLKVDIHLDDVEPENYDALVLPGGVFNPDFLRMNERAVAFVRWFFMTKRPVGAICHGPWTLIEADVVRGRTVTSYPSLKTDLRNAGAEWVDRDAVSDSGLVTSRRPDDLPAFNRALTQAIAEGLHEGQHAA